MKVTIAFLEDEAKTAGTIERFVASLMKKVKITRSDRHPPYRHTYIVDVQGGGKTKDDFREET